MRSQDTGLKDLFLVLSPLLLWASAGWFLYPSLVTIVDIPDAAAGDPMLSYLAGFICLIFGLIFLTYVLSRRSEIRYHK